MKIAAMLTGAYFFFYCFYFFRKVKVISAAHNAA